ncbi:MAG TPA: sodium/proline symporter [Rhabdochlamydiaceae bacterium]|jgi:sodium/proline symporter
MNIYTLLAIICYFAILISIGIFSFRRHLSASDFIIGGRSMNYWLTALAAHASDMSSWLFMGYPAVIFTGGLFNAWTAVGLLVFMYLNWQLIAPKIRVATEQYNSLTFSSFFEHRLSDTSGTIRVFTALMSLFFYTIYISAALVGLGLLMENLFNIDYVIGIILGILVVIPYVFTGGYVTLAWIDLFQGFFLLGVIFFVPFYILPKVGGWHAVREVAADKHLLLSFFPNFSAKTWLEIIGMTAGWGLGYFGQPHIITKFMGIRYVNEIAKSKWIGMTWMVLSLFGATIVGLVAIPYFSSGITYPERVFIEMVRESFPSFVVGFLLCAVLAATINAMSSQVLVLSSNITEDFYKRLIRKQASSKELLLVARAGVILVTIFAFIIAFGKFSTIYSLVLYAWSGLGASFGPLLLISLYSKSVNKYGAWCGILSGGILAAVWHLFNKSIPSLIPSFILSLFCILFISKLTNNKKVLNSKKISK